MLAVRKSGYSGWVVALVLALGFGLCVPAPAAAQKKRGSFFDKDANELQLKTSAKFLEAFRPVVDRVSASTVRVLCNGDDKSLGVVVAEDGFILTQFHDLTGKITVKLKDGTVQDAELVGVHVQHDLAMLKIKASHQLKPIVWGDSKSAPVGNFVASVGTGPDPVAIGVVSVGPRGPVFMRPGPNSGFLGIALADDPLGAKIGFADPKEAGAKAGLKANDIVLAVAGKKTPDSEALIRNVQRFKAGEIIELRIKRGTEELTLKATLGRRKQDVGEIQNNMGSRLSKLRGGYPMALQHDTVLQPTDCGSALVDLDGNVIGVNVSRYGRVETYAIPSEVVQPLLADLMSGKLMPGERKTEAAPK